jgi:hypothetical protein
MCAADAVPGHMRQPGIIWKKNLTVSITRAKNKTGFKWVKFPFYF